MNRILVVAFALLCTASRAFAEPSDEDNIALVNRVQARVATGDIDALTDLTHVPGKYSCPALFAIFKSNRKDAAITSKCAQLAVTVPGGEEFILNLLKREAANNPEFSQQEIAIHCLVLNHNKTSVRILAGTLDDFNPKEMGPIIIRALADLHPPASPTVPTGHEADAEILAQWKQWWNVNKSNFVDESAPK